MHEWQSLPLRSLSKYHRRHSRSSAREEELMHPFSYSCPTKIDEAMADAARSSKATFIAGGTTLLDLMKLNVMTPEALIDLNQLGFNKIEKRGSSVFIGALASNSDVAFNKIIHSEFPV